MLPLAAPKTRPFLNAFAPHRGLSYLRVGQKQNAFREACDARTARIGKRVVVLVIAACVLSRAHHWPRVKTAAASVVLLALAGCWSPSVPPSTSGPVPVPGGAASVLAHTLIGNGGDAETSHFVSPDGKTILACSHGGFTQPSPLWVSEDGGDTFRRLFPSPSPPVGGDCDVTITSDGSWYMVFDSLVSITVVGTSDQGNTWRFAYVTDPLLTNVDRPWIQAVGNTLYLTYADLMATQPIVLLFSQSNDRGRTWSVPALVTLPPAADETNCWVGHLVARDEGRTIRIPINCWNMAATGSGNDAIYFATSQDGGARWALEHVADGIGVPTASYGSDGSLWLAYATRDGSSVAVEARVAREGGSAFAPPMTVATLALDAFDWPWIDARPDGSASVAWMNLDTSEARTTFQPIIARVAANAPSPEFVVPIGEPWTGTTTFEFFMVKHDAAGHAYVVYPLGGDGCKVSPPVTGIGSTRNDLCVHLYKESP